MNSSLFEQYGPNKGYIEDLYRSYKQNPNSVPANWQTFFVQLETKFDSLSTNGRSYVPSATQDDRLQESSFRLVSAYRRFGHLIADINPLSQGIIPLPRVQSLDIDYYQFTEEQLEQEVLSYYFKGQRSMKLRNLIAGLQEVYAGSIGIEREHILNQEERYWLTSKFESRLEDQKQLKAEAKISQFKKVVDAETFEQQLHKRYIGIKRFSLEGSETLIPLVYTIIEDAAHSNAKEVVMGMAHRGRLNVLRNILNKPLQNIFYEFEDNSLYTAVGSGDVKYHMGFESQYSFDSGHEVKLTLAPNPSHLEFVCPVVEGIARAKQDLNYDLDRLSVLPILLHGDAAFIGQGVVTETLNFSQVNGYNVGGTIHVIINNQIGFTTTTEESRSSEYCTEFAKAISAPILHVNGDDVAAACWAASLALEYRERFQKDIVLDLYSYRKHGHNEGDDPSFTQPVLYQDVKNKRLISEIYGEKLVADKVLSPGEIETYKQDSAKEFKQEQEAIRPPQVMGEACALHGKLRTYPVKTAISAKQVKDLMDQMNTMPEGFSIYPKLKGIFDKRQETIEKGSGIDWGTAEALAFASLLEQDVSIRLTGQDSGRGTFSHRHVLINDSETGEHYSIMSPIADRTNSNFVAYNTTLSEAAVLGFEFGYSTEASNSLVLWEAQFGDFANGAQVIIDQFLSSSEQKWEQLSGLVLLLPHGFEGQGPEHSSARLERFLQLCADGNMVVCYPTNSAQYFHLLRHHALSAIKRPLVVMTPKSLLRANEANCRIGQFSRGTFQNIIVDDFDTTKTNRGTQLILTSGKIYYDIVKRLSTIKRANVRLIRIEQLYPFPQFELKKAIKDLKISSCVWVQEEPLNMGAWLYISPYITTKLDLDVDYVGRETSASPATGSPKRHAAEQEQIINELIDLLEIE